MKLTTKECYIVDKNGQDYFYMPISSRDSDTLLSIVKADGLKSVEIKKQGKVRSLSANAYSWQLITKLAKALTIPKGDAYVKMVKRYGQYVSLSVISEALQETMKVWDSANTDVEHTENLCEVVGNHRNGPKTYIELHGYLGTSNKEVYDTKTFSQYLEGIVSECKLMDIETKSENEIKSMMENYNV